MDVFHLQDIHGVMKCKSAYACGKLLALHVTWRVVIAPQLLLGVTETNLDVLHLLDMYGVMKRKSVYVHGKLLALHVTWKVVLMDKHSVKFCPLTFVHVLLNLHC